MKIQERITTLTEEVKDDNTTSLWRVCRGIVENVSQHNKQIIAQMRDYDTHDKEHSEKVLEFLGDDALQILLRAVRVVPLDLDVRLTVVVVLRAARIVQMSGGNERFIGQISVDVLARHAVLLHRQTHALASHIHTCNTICIQ